MKFGSSLGLWEQRAVHGMPPKVITSAEKIQNTGLGWKGHVDCFLEFGTCCSCRLSWKRNKNKLSKLHWKTLTALKRRIERIRIRNETLLQHDNARPHRSVATRGAIQRLDYSVLPHPPYSPSLWFPPVPKPKGTLEETALQLWWRGEVCRAEMVSEQNTIF